MKSSTRLRFIAFLILSISISGAAFGTTFPVTKIADTADGTCDSDCSLREAVIAANANAGADTITLPAGTYTLSIAGAGEAASQTGDLDITQSLTLTGAGSATTIIDGGAIDRVFEIIGGTTTVSISGVTIRNGHPPATSPNQGGGILSSGALLTLDHVVVTANTTANQGGGIFSIGTLVVLNSSVTANVTPDQGGGIFAGGTTTIDHSTVSGNLNQDQGAGIFNLNGSLFIIESTISNNTGTDNGGGLYNNPPPQTPNSVLISGSTIADNSSGTSQGGGIYNLSPGFVTINGVILANNTGGNAPDCAGTITSLGYNLIENATNCTIAGNTVGNKTGQDPQLLALGNYGGPTQTRKLGGTSPAIDMWTGCSAAAPPPALRAETVTGGPTDDQRGQPRPAGVTCDMGAFECQGTECAAGVPTPTPTATVPAPTATATPTVTASGGVPPTVPTLSFPMLALLGLALAGAAIFVIKRS